jgi:ATP-dependent Clp protease, protease subunit
VLKGVNQSLANAYRLRTGLSDAKLLEMMDIETWMTPEQALELNFVDGIMFADDNWQSDKGGTSATSISGKRIAAKLKALKNHDAVRTKQQLKLLKLRAV